MKTLYSKLTLSTIGIILIGAIGGFLLMNIFYHQTMKEKNDAKNMAILTNMVTYIEKDKSLDLTHYLTLMANMGYQIYTVDQDGKERYFGGEFREKELATSNIKDVFAGESYHGMRDFPPKTFTTGFFANELTNTVGQSFTYEGQTSALFIRPNISLLFSEVHSIMSGWLLAGLSIGFIAMLYFLRFLIRPIVKLTAATKRIANEQFDEELPVKSKDEIGQLTISFNKMTKQLQENDLLRKEFISNVSHDFQSPLQNVQGYAQLLQAEQLTVENRLQYAIIIQEEMNRLSILTKQILLLTSIEQSSRILKKEPYAIDRQIKEIVHKYHWIVEEKHIELLLQTPPTLFNGDASLMEHVFDNLLSNAIKYNQNGGAIEIRIVKSPILQIDIIDTGIGIAKDEMQKIFERFYRIDESRTTNGTGLGLAIVKEIIELHGGKIEIKSSLNKGTTFSLKFI